MVTNSERWFVPATTDKCGYIYDQKLLQSVQYYALGWYIHIISKLMLLRSSLEVPHTLATPFFHCIHQQPHKHIHDSIVVGIFQVEKANVCIVACKMDM